MPNWAIIRVRSMPAILKSLLLLPLLSVRGAPARKHARGELSAKEPFERDAAKDLERPFLSKIKSVPKAGRCFQRVKNCGDVDQAITFDGIFYLHGCSKYYCAQPRCSPTSARSGPPHV